MTDAQKLAAIRAILDAPADQPPGDPQPQPNPQPQPPHPTGEYPSGDQLQFILSTLSWDYNTNNAALTGMVGNPLQDLFDANNGDQAAVARVHARTVGANGLRTAAHWLRVGKTQEQTLAFLNVSNLPTTPEQLAALVTVMQHYALLP